jgi:mRNA interferase RelE/StbE
VPYTRATFPTDAVIDALSCFAASARKELRDLPSEAVARLLPRIRELATNPRPPGCRKLRGYTKRWRIRVGDYRVIYAVADAERVVDITDIDAVVAGPARWLGVIPTLPGSRLSR